jgi:hypothetical protein
MLMMIDTFRLMEGLIRCMTHTTDKCEMYMNLIKGMSQVIQRRFLQEAGGI